MIKQVAVIIFSEFGEFRENPNVAWVPDYTISNNKYIPRSGTKSQIFQITSGKIFIEVIGNKYLTSGSNGSVLLLLPLVIYSTCVEWEIFFQMNYSHTLLIPEITQVQKVKWCMTKIHLKDPPFNICLDGHID